ncbi:MAG: hypothetical protein HY611_01125 [Elusimicrobia bacterium]|nr:hypothetical protein [Elusimicrobiota bacterium]
MPRSHLKRLIPLILSACLAWPGAFCMGATGAGRARNSRFKPYEFALLPAGRAQMGQAFLHDLNLHVQLIFDSERQLEGRRFSFDTFQAASFVPNADSYAASAWFLIDTLSNPDKADGRLSILKKASPRLAKKVEKLADIAAADRSVLQESLGFYRQIEADRNKGKLDALLSAFFDGVSQLGPGDAPAVYGAYGRKKGPEAGRTPPLRPLPGNPPKPSQK